MSALVGTKPHVMSTTKRTLLLLLALTTGSAICAQGVQFQPFGELSAGTVRFRTATLPTYGATLGLQSEGCSVGLRYRYAASPLREAEVSHDVSLLLQQSTRLAPRLELFGGVATGFAVQHSRLLYDKPLHDGLTTAFSAEVNLGLRYYVSDNVALTLNLGAGFRLSAQEWRALVRQLPYDPRSVPTFVTATGGVAIGIPPKQKRLNLPPQLVVEGDAPILANYE